MAATADCKATTTWSAAHSAALAHGAERCSIDRFTEADLSLPRFQEEYEHKRPVIFIRGAEAASAPARLATEKQTLLDEHGARWLRLSAMQSYAFRNRTEVTLRDFLKLIQTPVSWDDTASELQYLFAHDPFEVGKVYVPPRHSQPQLEHAHSRPHYQVALGGPGSGLAFHWHGSVFAETLHGRRRWFAYPPHASPEGGFNPRRPTVHWLRNVYPHLAEQSTASQLAECVLTAGEVLYLPAYW